MFGLVGCFGFFSDYLPLPLHSYGKFPEEIHKRSDGIKFSFSWQMEEIRKESHINQVSIPAILTFEVSFINQNKSRVGKLALFSVAGVYSGE